MGEPGRCDIAPGTVESVARPVDQASAGFLDWVGPRTNADPAGSALLSTAKSAICFEGFERRPAFDARRCDGQFSPIERDGEAKPIRGCGARTESPSVNRAGAAVVAPGPYCPGLDDAAVSRGQLGLNSTGDSKNGQFPLTSMAVPRRAPKESWQRKAVSRRPRNRPGHSARELFNNVPRGDRSSGLQGFLYSGRFNLPHVWQDNRLLGLDPFDWFVLLGGSALSGAMVWLS
jgi:hypothetical protein